MIYVVLNQGGVMIYTSLIEPIPENIVGLCLASVGLMLGQRRRSWVNVKPTLV